MKTRYRNWINRFMLLSGCVLLLTVLIPHHHHEDGSPCIFWADSENTTGEDEDGHCRSCEYNGHTIVFNSASLQKYASETHDDPAWLLIPLHILFDYINPSLPFPDDGVPDFAGNVPAASIHCTWVAVAAGFRAPPFC
ncbi:MAG: hypothetical protein LBS05_04665 [Tannerellaceae bacterium]|jgi:hypothetical protein|nr:hypothetical protein [Tannerellaceae bacterium]